MQSGCRDFAEPSINVITCSDEALNSTSDGRDITTQNSALEPVLDLASLSNIFELPPNGQVALRNLLITGALLPTSPYPLPASSFLALSAFNLSATVSSSSIAVNGGSSGGDGSSNDTQSPGRSPPYPQSPPPLLLSDLLITTPSCSALALHQAIACAASPSPNFTITPSALVVHEFSTPTAVITNVTLTCSGQPLMYPCTALRATTGAEVLQGMRTLEGFAQQAAAELSRKSAFLFLARNITLASTTTGNTSTANQQLTIQTANIILSGAPGGGTVLDLAGTAGLVAITGAGTIQMHNLTLRNLQTGQVGTYPWGLLRLGLWTFSFGRRLYGRRGDPYLLLRRVSVLGLPTEEVAAFWADLVRLKMVGDAAPPPSLAPCLCIKAQTLLTGTARWIEGEVPYLETDRVTSAGDGLTLEQVRVYAADSNGDTASAASASASASVAAPACLRGVLCQLVPEGPQERPWTLRIAAMWDEVILNSVDPQAVPHSASMSYTLNRPVGRLVQLADRPVVTILQPIALMGDPFGESVLDLQAATAVWCLRGAAGSLTLRHMVLIGLTMLRNAAECTVAPPRSPPRPSLQPPPQQPPGSEPTGPPAPAPVTSAAAAALPLLLPAEAQSVGGSEGGGTGPPPGQPAANPPIAQGFDFAIASFMSCIWALDFDRPGNGSGSAATSNLVASDRPVGLPYVFLDTVSILIPQAELDVFIWIWVTNSTEVYGARLGLLLVGERQVLEAANTQHVIRG
ncbi:hypothetical protein VOLCADRAFT_98100 [Volvox carteri f. nagariensis]|uniref:Uncharacterized protein n=1 Tax=Volvox carteri f. nagariensis TaxID=3068 RepID=D8UEF9_VOLCA|nr:uncharacterized protein VOLCADRAFT_98100 [Volvox carteri f. nagariensis]EFJ41875.1 hypothetical protein VOLCADRAFT_98100 [Volvox carteri f. nagariensis]|eukprot:XP_002957073.1 hypothetical protein VOLCADRAFT_98100 [Volvox carteri f. nagariensis]